MKPGDLVKITTDWASEAGNVGLITKIESSISMENIFYVSVLVYCKIKNKCLEHCYLHEDLSLI